MCQVFERCPGHNANTAVNIQSGIYGTKVNNAEDFCTSKKDIKNTLLNSMMMI